MQLSRFHLQNPLLFRDRIYERRYLVLKVGTNGDQG